MKTKSLHKPRVNVVTLGCSKNVFDSEILMAQLRANDLEVKHESDKEDFDTVIINTCGFIDTAKQESIDTILQFADAKKKGWIEKVIVTGCLSERYHTELEKEIPEIDSWFGTRDLPRLLKTLKADYKHELVGERLLTTPLHYAYFKIAEGCDRPCAFCAIPLMRGKHTSTPMEDLVKQAKNLVKNGTKELIVIAQDSTYYGLDIYGERKLAELLKRLADVEGLEWIRLHYAYPAGFPMDVIKVMKEHSNICNYLDMPLQHISDPVLKAMRRGTTFEKTNRLIHEIRDILPEIALRTTLISGFPGETEADHGQLLRWVEETRFERLGVFPYSHEENTHAYRLQDDVPEETKQQRAEEIMEVQGEISLQKNEARVGSVLKVLVDRKEGPYYIARSEADSPEVDNEVVIDTKENYLRTGDFATVKITGASHYDLQAELI